MLCKKFVNTAPKWPKNNCDCRFEFPKSKSQRIISRQGDQDVIKLHMSLPSSGSAPCMFGAPSPFTSQDAMLAQQRLPSSTDVQDLVSSLPPINTVFMGAGGVQ